MEQPKPSDTQVKVRLDKSVRDEIKVLAAQNRRTMAREIEFRVIESIKREKMTQGAVA